MAVVTGPPVERNDDHAICLGCCNAIRNLQHPSEIPRRFMNGTDALTPLAAARAMLDILVSVGAGHFHVIWTNGEAQPRRARSLRQSLAAIGGPLPRADNPDWLDAIHIARISAADLDRAMPALLETAFADRLNLNVRPYGEDVWFIQLDDIPPDALLRASAAMFLHIQTSPASIRHGSHCPGSLTGSSPGASDAVPAVT
jgi:hypothetical protein